MLRSTSLVPTLVLLAATSLAEPAPRTLVYVVRHGEKATEPRRDPGLTPEGEARADALAERFADAGLTGIVTSQFTRTRATARPLAKTTGLTPVVIRYRPGDFEAHGRLVAEKILAGFRGGVVLVVGHSDTVPWIVRALGGPEMEQLCEATEYASVLELTLEDGRPTVFARSSYGKPDPPEPEDCRLPRGR
jgi:broad specificity phosphatase PhoE